MWWIFSVSLLFLLVSSSSSALEVHHAQVSSIAVSTTQVFGVTLINPSDTSSTHFLDCTSPSTPPGQLRWEREEGTHRFDTYASPDLTSLRLDLAPKSGPFTSADLGVYICVDTATGERQSVTIADGAAAVVPVQANIVTIVGHRTELRVNTISVSPLTSEEVQWTGPRGQPLPSGSLDLEQGSSLLVLEDVVLEDSGVYRVNIVRGGVVVASTTISLNVQVGPLIVQSPMSAQTTEHESVVFSCVMSGNPQPAVTWEREGADMQLPVATRRTISSTSVSNESLTLYTVNSTLEISTVLYQDRGRYRCRATNTLTGNVPQEAVSEYAELQVTPQLQLTARAPTLIDSRGVVITGEDSRVVIHCSSSSTMHWGASTGVDIPEETALTTSLNVYQRSDVTNNEQILFIERFSAELGGIYTCNTDLVVEGESIAISVFITDADPAVEFTDTTVYTLEDHRAEMVATVHSSDLSTVLLQWYYEDTLLDTSSSDPHYQVEEVGGEEGRYVLRVRNVGAEDLGTYRVLASVGERNDSDTVQLRFADPPTATVAPAHYTVSEQGSISIRCSGQGTLPSVTWSATGGGTLPTGVYQERNELVVEQASRNHTGQYQCTVTNAVGLSDVSTASLTVNYAPTALIVHNEGSETLTNNFIQITAEDGDTAPIITCSSDGSPVPSLTWTRDPSSLPDGVTAESDGRRLRSLLWSRPLKFTDSGTYTCASVNRLGKSQATLELLIRKRPTITSIFPTLPVLSSPSSPDFVIPRGLNTTLLTCTAFGWPAPTVRWLKDGEEVTGRVAYQTVGRNGSAFVSSMLSLVDGFRKSDAGQYICVAEINDTDYYHVQSKMVALEDRPPLAQEITPSACSVESREVSFQLRVSGVECSNWRESIEQQVTENVHNVLSSVVYAMCVECSASLSDVITINRLQCIGEGGPGVLVSGAISTDRRRTTQEILCTLRKWQESRPFLQIGDRYYRIDKDCDIAAESPAGRECLTESLSLSAANTLPTISGFMLTIAASFIIMLSLH